MIIEKIISQNVFLKNFLLEKLMQITWSDKMAVVNYICAHTTK